VCFVGVEVDVYCVPEINMKLCITVGVFPELKQQGGPHQGHISKKKQQEVAHKFLLYMRVAEAHACCRSPRMTVQQ